MVAQFDVIVVGLGGMGSAAAYHLAARGKRVLGLEQYTPVHDRGSSHGQSRIIRQAYFEDPAYVPLVLRAYELWDQLERETGQSLLTITGGLMLGTPTSDVVTGSLQSAQQYQLPYNMLDAADIHRRFPPFTPDANTVGFYEHNAGFLRVEAAVGAHLGRAQQLGAQLHFAQPVEHWEAAGDAVIVTTAAGQYTAEHVVIAPGAWAAHLLAALHLPLMVERQVQFWFEPQGSIEAFLPDRFPIYIWETEELTFYGFPALDQSRNEVKAAIHHGGEICTPDTIRRAVGADEVEHMQRVLAGRVPALNGPCRQSLTCMYTNTPDQHFVIAPHPNHPNVVIAAGFSGHGFKFASVVGEMLADLVVDGATPHSTGLFTPQRFR
jgi:sarcosine oxidase